MLRDIAGDDAAAPREIGAGELRQEDVLDILGTERAVPEAETPAVPEPLEPEEAPAEDAPAEADPQ